MKRGFLIFLSFSFVLSGFPGHGQQVSSGLRREATGRAAFKSQFYREFLALPPEERVRLWADAWRHGKAWREWTKRFGDDVNQSLEDALTAKPDVVPALAAIV